MAVTSDDLAEPPRARLRAEEQEQEGERQLLAVLERDPLQPSVLTVKLGDFAAIAHGDSVALELVD